MAMTTKGIVASRAADGPNGGAIVETESQGKPSANPTTPTQSPSGLVQPKGPTVVATFTGND